MSQPTFDFLIPKNFPKRAKAVKLSPKETQVVELILKDEKNATIAEALKISVHTVDNHVRRIYHKTGLHTRTGLVSFFLQ